MPIRRTDPKYIAVLAVSCLLILLIGALIRPSNDPEGNQANVAADLLQSERIAQRRGVDQIADYFAYVAEQVEDSVVLLGSTRQSGVIWQAGEVVTASRLGPFPAKDRTALGNREVVLTTRVAAPHLPYVVLASPSGRDCKRPQGRCDCTGRGAWLLGVWRVARRRPAVFVGQPVRRHGPALRRTGSLRDPDKPRSRIHAARRWDLLG